MLGVREEEECGFDSNLDGISSGMSASEMKKERKEEKKKECRCAGELIKFAVI